MLAVKPVIPREFLASDATEATVNGPNNQFTDLPVAISMEPDGQFIYVIAQWTLTPEERQAIAEGQDVFVSICTTHRINPYFLSVGPVDWTKKADG